MQHKGIKDKLATLFYRALPEVWYNTPILLTIVNHIYTRMYSELPIYTKVHSMMVNMYNPP